MSNTLRNRVYRFLRGSENFFRTDMIYLTKGGIWLSIGQAFAMLSGFLLSIAFANLLTQEAFGNYKFVISVTAILGVLSLSGINTSVIQSVARGFDSSLERGFIFQIKWSLAVFIGGLILGGYYFFNDNLLLSFSFLLAGITAPVTTSSGLYSSFLLGKKDFRKNSLYSIIRNVFPALALIVTLFFTQNLFIIISVYFLIGTLVPFYLYKKTLDAHKNLGKAEDPEFLSYSSHLSIMDVVSKIGSFIDKVLVFHFLGAAPLAIYSFATAPIEQLQGGKKIISTLIQPKLNEKTFEEIQETSLRKSLMLTLYALLLIGVYVFASPYFFRMFYPQYLDSVFFSQLYSLTLLAISGSIFNEALIAHKKTRELYIHRTIVPTVKIALFVVLLPLYGLSGLVVAHIITVNLSTILGYYFVRFPLKG